MPYYPSIFVSINKCDNRRCVMCGPWYWRLLYWAVGYAPDARVGR
jgi:hypothetical protein